MRMLVLCAVTVYAVPATAGEVVFRDDARIVAADRQVALQSAASRWPFRLRVLTGNYFSRADLERDVSACVSAPDRVCVGIDPGHRFTSTHFGTGTGVRPSEFSSIAAAGNSRFKTADWGGGIEMIADRALESIRSAQQAVVRVEVHSPTPVVVPAAESYPAQSSSSVWWWVFGLIALGGAVWLLVAIFRRQNKLDRDMGSYREERDEFMNKNVDRMTRPAPAPRSPLRSVPRSQPAAQASASSSSSVVVVSATPVVIVPEPSRPAPAPHSSRSSDDAGGSSSSWSSSDDSGGSSSDFGSSFDSGGGFDGGGGGSDF